jgi:hypothetical protein
MFVGTFEFEEGGRLYRCRVEGERSARAGAWWWFDVSGDAQPVAFGTTTQPAPDAAAVPAEPAQTGDTSGEDGA